MDPTFGIFDGLGTELHSLWLVLLAIARFLWKGIGPFGGTLGRVFQEHAEMYERFKYERQKEDSMQRQVPDFVKEEKPG